MYASPVIGCTFPEVCLNWVQQLFSFKRNRMLLFWPVTVLVLGNLQLQSPLIMIDRVFSFFF